MEIFEHFSIKEIITCFMVLFAVIDIIGSIPIVVSLQQNSDRLKQERHRLQQEELCLFFFL
jgi:multiple antibiotic resistance protein